MIDLSTPIAGNDPNAARRRGDPCTQYFWVVRSLARLRRAAFAALFACLLSACLLAACAPTLRVDAPAMPALDPPPRATQCACAEKIAPLEARPQLPDAEQSPCPAGSGLAACFTHEQDALRRRRFTILHDDRDYCRDAYDRAVKRVAQ